MRILGAYEDRRPARSVGGPATGPPRHRRRSPRPKGRYNLACKARLGLGNHPCNLGRTPRDLAWYIKAGRGEVSIIQSPIYTSGLARTRLDLPCNRPLT